MDLLECELFTTMEVRLISKLDSQENVKQVWKIFMATQPAKVILVWSLNALTCINLRGHA